MVIGLAGSEFQMPIMCMGIGVQPRILFEKEALEFNPLVPGSIESADMQPLIVRNPCNFPVEFYCLNFDECYIKVRPTFFLVK